MRALLLVVLLCAGCPEKKKAPPPPSEPVGSNPSPAVEPVKTKLDDTMKVNEDRATPNPE